MRSQRLSDPVRGGVPDRTCTIQSTDGGATSTKLLVMLALITLLTIPAWAQGPESYGLPHLFSLPTATTTRQFGMGGMTSCVQDIGFPNPAFAGALDGAQAAVRFSCTDFDNGLKLKGTQAWYADTLGEGKGYQILGFLLDSNEGTFTTPLGPLSGTVNETDVAFHYGHRLSDQWLVGVGLAPMLKTKSELTHPLTGDTIVRWDSKATFGGRVGALYQFAPEGFAGFVLDHYKEDVTMQMAGQPDAEFDFTSTEWALGVSGRIDEKLLGAIEWMQLTSKDGDFEGEAEGLHLGLEYSAAPGVAVRAGSSDGALTLGAGYSRDGWVVNYAFISDWNDDSVGEMLGGSDTHQLEVGKYW